MNPAQKFGVALACLVPLFSCRADRALTREGEPTSHRASQVERIIEIDFLTSLSGYLEPCGCTTRPLGGIQRLATVLASGLPSRIVIDAGDALFPTEGYSTESADQHRLKARLLARVYRTLGLQAINLGPADLTEGSAFLAELQRDGALPLVSANIRPTTGAPLSVARSFLREAGQIKVGITGVTLPESIRATDSIAALEVASTVRAEVAALLARHADLVVVVAHMQEREATELIDAVPNIDVVVRAPGTPIVSPPRVPVKYNGAVILEAGSQGQHLGRLVVRLTNAPRQGPIPFDDSALVHAREQDLLRRKIRAFKHEVEQWRGDPKKAETVRVREDQIRKLEATLSKTPSPSPAAPPFMTFALIPLDDTIAADPSMTTLLDAYNLQLRRLNEKKGDPAACKPNKGEATYVGTEACGKCHEDEVAFWSKTKHAKAWDTLVRATKEYDLTCVGCHSVGFQKRGGFCRLIDIGEKINVGCESCHGPGSEHQKSEDPSHIQLGTGQKTCTDMCHVPEHSDGFDYVPYLSRITGIGHEARSSTTAGP